MSSFGLIRDIIPEDSSTWKDRTFLTLDIDWAPDFVLEAAIEKVEEMRVPATWFVTHATPLLERLRQSGLFDLGVHPNFDRALFGKGGPTASETIKDIMEIVPEAVSVRSHSMTQSTKLQDLFGSFGLTHDCNHFIPCQAEMEVKPWRLWNDMIKVPYIWEDDIDILYGPSSMEKSRKVEGMKVYDFHPIHLYLNTADMAAYEKAKLCLSEGKGIQPLVNTGYGTVHKLEWLGQPLKESSLV